MKNELNIVLYVNSFLPVLGGKEFVVHYLADALQTLGHKVRVVGPAGFWRHRHVHFNYPVHRWPKLRGWMPQYVAAGEFFLDTLLWGCDVVHAHNTYPAGYVASRLRKIRNFPLVITPHGQDIQSIPELGHGLRLDPIKNKKIETAVQSADFVTAISNNIEAALIDAGAEKKNIRLIPNGVDLQRYSRSPSQEIRKWLGVDPEARLIVTIGRYNPRKGQDYLVRAMPKILEIEPRARLVIVGDRTEMLLPQIQKLGLEDKVVLTGGISPTRGILTRSAGVSGGDAETDRLAEILCSSELYVSAGIQNNAEGLSLAVLEAMASGLPVVATAISGNTDVISDGYNGFLIEPANEEQLSGSVVRVLAQKQTQERMRENARATAGQYAWINIAQRYVDVYREAISRYRQSGRSSQRIFRRIS